jgi:hypothetical protein
MSDKPVWDRAHESIAETIQRAGCKPLSAEQRQVLAGALVVWMTKAGNDALEQAAAAMQPALRSMISRGEAAARILELKA